MSHEVVIQLSILHPALVPELTKKCAVNLQDVGAFVTYDIASGAVAADMTTDVGPNITGHIQESGDTLDEEGCFYLLFQSGGWVDGGLGGIRKVVGFDASRSSTEYGRSSEVQVASVRNLPCIKS